MAISGHLRSVDKSLRDDLADRPTLAKINYCAGNRLDGVSLATLYLSLVARRYSGAMPRRAGGGVKAEQGR